jgi:hypothetical protein
MRKYVGLFLIAAIFSAMIASVFAIPITFMRQSNVVTTTTIPSVSVNPGQPAPNPNPSYDWTTPFMAYARIKAEGGTLVKLHGWTGTLTGATLKIKLFTYQGTTKLYGPSTLYMRGTLSNGDHFFASVYMPIQNVEVYEFSEDRIYFNANTAGMLIINYDTGERIRPALDTIRFDIDFVGVTVNGAGGVGVGSDNEFRISGMSITEHEYTEYG